MLIIFDLDDTLIDTTGSITPGLLQKALHGMVKAGLKVDSFEDALATLRRLDLTAESALHTLQEFMELVDADPSLLSIGEQIIYGEIAEDFSVFPLDEAYEVLEQLKEQHSLALVSIGQQERQMRKMENAGLDSTIFSKIVILQQENKKPAYQKVLEEINAQPAKTVVCGDRIERDLTPAKQLGCKTIHMRWGRGLGMKARRLHSDVDFTVYRLNQIQEIIERL